VGLNCRPRQKASMIGTTVGHFRVVGYLGRGASATVYRAVDEILDREVALKVLNPGQIDPDAVTRFRAEATALAKLNHPAIATIYEMLESDGHLVMAMECARGETLDQLSERLGPLPPERAVYLTERILAALDHAHRAGILHRDIKPANVMVSDDELKITDFGIAQMLGDQQAGPEGDEGMLGTPAYMAPEQVLGQPLDARTDLYAVGVILYRLLTATLPFDGEIPAVVLRRQVGDAPPPLRTRRGGLPAWCEPIVHRALAKSKAERFQTADEFREALTRAAIPASVAPLRRAGGLRGTYGLLGAISAATAAALLAYAGAHHIPITSPPTVSESRIAAAPAPSIESPEGDATAAAAPPLEALKPLPESRAEKSETRFPRLEFDTKALVADGGKARERSARLVLADRTLTVTDVEAGRSLHSLPYESITSINYSHSRDPLWASPAGPAPIIRATGGVLRTFGFSVNRDWVSLITRTSIRFVVLRIADDDVTHLLSALQDRTHRTVRRLEPKRDSGRRSIL
jgi:serine/threonine protein kinase